MDWEWPKESTFKQSSYLEEQKMVIYRWLTITNNPIMSQMCSSIDTSIILTPSLLSTDCGMEMIKENLVIQIPKGHVLPINFLWFGLILAIVPPHYRSRGTTSWFIRVSFLGYLVVQIITMPIVQRYIYFYYATALYFDLGYSTFCSPKHGYGQCVYVPSLLILYFILHQSHLHHILPTTNTTIFPRRSKRFYLRMQTILTVVAMESIFIYSGKYHSLHTTSSSFKHILADSFVHEYVLHQLDLFTLVGRKPYPNAYIGLVKNIGGTPKDQLLRFS